MGTIGLLLQDMECFTRPTEKGGVQPTKNGSAKWGQKHRKRALLWNTSSEFNMAKYYTKKHIKGFWARYLWEDAPNARIRIRRGCCTAELGTGRGGTTSTNSKLRTRRKKTRTSRYRRAYVRCPRKGRGKKVVRFKGNRRKGGTCLDARRETSTRSEPRKRKRAQEESGRPPARGQTQVINLKGAGNSPTRGEKRLGWTKD